MIDTIHVARLLIVDDEPAQMKALCNTLESEGYRVTGFTSANAALARLQEEDFDVLLTDLMMPDRDGIAFLSEALQIDPNLGGIVMTGHGAIDTAVRAMQAGAMDYILKPFKLTAILPVIARALALRRLRVENIQLHQAVGIYEVSMAIASARDSETVLEKAIDAVWTQIPARDVSVLLLCDDARELRVAAARGEGAERSRGTRISAGPALLDWAGRSSEPRSLSEKSTDQYSVLGSGPDTVSIPMLAAGKWIGILKVTLANSQRPLAPGQVKALSILANAAASAFETTSLLERLSAAEERYRRLAENAPDIVFRYELSPPARFVYVNPTVAAVTGYTPEEFYADPELALKITHPEDHGLMETLLDGRYASGSTITIRYLHKNGVVLWIEQRIMVVRDSEGRLLGIDGIARDISERRQLEEQLRQSQKMEAIGRLAGGVSHDFNNLLVVINGYSDLVLNDYEVASPIREKLTEIRKAGENAAALTRQLLAFSRRQLVNPQVMNINSVVESNSKILRRIIGEDIELVAILDPDVESIKADPSQVEQILMNLAVNARDAMAKGGTLTIETRNVRLDESDANEDFPVTAGDYVMLEVSDTGCGMDAGTKSQIFDPFFTTKEAGRGTGLGLSIVYGIVKQSEGYIRVDSEPGKGASFKICFPLVRESRAVAAPTSVPASSPRGSETILIVEDDSGVRQLVSTVLRSAGYQVLECGNGKEALKMFRENEHRVGLVLTDLVMPQMSGVEMAEKLRAMNPLMRIIFMSGYADDAVLRHVHVEAGTPFIQKPFSAAKLLEMVREVLNRRAAGTGVVSA